MLSCRGSLLLDIRSKVPAEEVALLHYADLPLSDGLFPSPLLEKCAASNDALVQRTLHPPKIPQKSSAGPVKAAPSSASSADHSGGGPPHPARALPQSQQQALMAPSSSFAQQGRKQRGRKGKAPFSSASGSSGCCGGKRIGAGKKSS